MLAKSIEEKNMSRSNSSNTPAQLSLLRLSQMRKEIDSIDDQISQLLLRRLEIACALGNLKRELGLPLKDPTREDLVLEKVKSNVSASPLKKHVVSLYKAIVSESCKLQMEELEQEPD